MYTFSLVIGIGATLGLGWVAWQSAEDHTQRRLNAGLWVLFGALVGGRAAFVSLAWPYFQAHPLEIPQVWLGGLSGPGALAGWLLALVLVALFTRLPLGALADALLPLAVALMVSAWLACWQTGCAYGRPVTAWWGIPARDEWGRLSARWPTQLLGASLALLIAWLLDFFLGFTHRGRETAGEDLPHREPLTQPGVAASLWLLCMALGLFGLSFLRADPVPAWLGLRLDAWAALGFAFIAVIALLASILRGPRVDQGVGDSVLG